MKFTRRIEQRLGSVVLRAKGIPSGHVILISSNVTKGMIKIAASYTKQQSKWKNVPKLTIEYTEIGNVKKTGKIGEVIYLKKPNTIVI